ncbi:MAG: thioesterase family protein [Burkholderiales bacterium]
MALSIPEELKPGLSGTAEIVVGTRDTAPHVGSGKIGVLATPIMVNLMEAAALQAVERFMPPGHQTVGTHLDVRHFAATPVGMRVRARAELVRVEGRTLTFRIGAEDEREKIGEGAHERLIINVERFDQRMQKKLAR